MAHRAPEAPAASHCAPTDAQKEDSKEEITA